MNPLFIVCGNAGVGKTTFGLKLAAEHAAAFLDIDTVSELLVKAGLSSSGMDPDDRDSPYFKAVYREAIHDTLFNIAAQNLPHQTCVISAPFTQERRDPLFLSTIEERLGAKVQLYYLICSEDTRKQRIIARKNPRDAGKLVNWGSYSAHGQDAGSPPFPHILVQTD